MRIVLWLLLLIIPNQQIFSQTNADPPTAENVLVVYREGIISSVNIANHYASLRQIPETHKFPVDLSEYHNYNVTIEDVEETIKGVGRETGWLFVKEKIADPIEYHLNNTYYNGQLLKDIIRYIVLCKGIPHKIDDASVNDITDQTRKDVSVDALLCLINQGNGKNILDLYGTGPNESNPYYLSDITYSMNYRFKSNHFERDGWKLQYLVSRLDGDNYEDVIALIDRSYTVNVSGNEYWILDHDLAAPGNGTVTNVFLALEQIDGINVNYDGNSPNVSQPIIENDGDVIGYISHGVHSGGTGAGILNERYILDTLTFQYANGAIFNSLESYNGAYFGSGRGSQGLVSDFIHMGGTAAGGNVWEPTVPNVYNSSISYPAYAFGYNLVDAIWMGYKNIAYRNIVVGDPLVKLPECEPIVISSNTTLSSGEYYCDIKVNEGVVLSIAPGAVINFKRNSKLKLTGSLDLGLNSTLNFNSYTHLVLNENSNLTYGAGAQINFDDLSTLEINRIYEINELSPFYFTSSSNMIINNYVTFNGNNLNINCGSISLKSSAQLTSNSTLNLLNPKFLIEGALTLDPGSTMILNGGSWLNVMSGGEIKVGSYATLEFNNYCVSYNDGRMIFDKESTFNIKNSSAFKNSGYCYVDEGSIFNFLSTSNDFSSIGGVFKSYGTGLKKVLINANQTNLNFSNLDSLVLSNSILNIWQTQISGKYISIDNSFFNFSNLLNIINSATEGELIITDSEIYSSTGKGINVKGWNYVNLSRNIIHNNGTLDGPGIAFYNNLLIEIQDCSISNFYEGIKQARVGEDDLITSVDEEIFIKRNLIEGKGFDKGIGIFGGWTSSNTITLTVENNSITGFETAVLVNNQKNFSPFIKNNEISNYGSFGISVSGGNSAIIEGNRIIANGTSAENCNGIILTIVESPQIIGNIITAEGIQMPGPGIILISCNGDIRRNSIQYHLYGIELGSSSPNIAENLITGNKMYGMYISAGSHPNLGKSIIGGELYPISGFNIIRENGDCNFHSYGELFFSRSDANLDYGCNTIADDREEDPILHCSYLYLIDSNSRERIKARENYWGNHPQYNNDPSARIGSELIIDYSNYLSDPCFYENTDNFILFYKSSGEVYDTIFSYGTQSMLSDLEIRYSNANNHFYNNQYTQAKEIYDGIIQEYSGNGLSLTALQRLYSVANFMKYPPSLFSQLRDYYIQYAGYEPDSIVNSIILHLSDLCLVSAEEYLSAIQKFEELAQQNNNNDIGLYRQIDAITASFLMPKDSLLLKDPSNKFNINESVYSKKLNNLLKKRGVKSLESDDDLIPLSFQLYQNYPNPFNPTTTIKYDIPIVDKVELDVFDILGRKVMTLVNETKEPGKYHIAFDASGMASGVYLYRIKCSSFISTKKMMVIK